MQRTMMVGCECKIINVYDHHRQQYKQSNVHRLIVNEYVYDALTDPDSTVGRASSKGRGRSRINPGSGHVLASRGSASTVWPVYLCSG